MAEFDLLCLTRCYRRPEMLGAVLRLALHDMSRAGVNPFVVIGPDPRASQSVLRVIDAFQHYPNVLVAPPSKPVLSAEGGQQWIQVLNEMSEAFDSTGHTARWSMDLDDDVAFSLGWDSLLARLLDDDSTDAYTAISLFLWDELGQRVNLRQHHWSPWLGRYSAHELRHTRRENRVLDYVQTSIDTDPRRLKTMPFYLLDYGSCMESERVRCFKDCARAGKLDNYTKKYIEPPQLMDLAEILRKFPNPADFMAWQRGLLF